MDAAPLGEDRGCTFETTDSCTMKCRLDDDVKIWLDGVKEASLMVMVSLRWWVQR